MSMDNLYVIVHIGFAIYETDGYLYVDKSYAEEKARRLGEQIKNLKFVVMSLDDYLYELRQRY